MEQQDRYIRFDWAVKVPSPPKSKFWCVGGLLDCAFDTDFLFVYSRITPFESDSLFI